MLNARVLEAKEAKKAALKVVADARKEERLAIKARDHMELRTPSRKKTAALMEFTERANDMLSLCEKNIELLNKAADAELELQMQAMALNGYVIHLVLPTFETLHSKLVCIMFRSKQVVVPRADDGMELALKMKNQAIGTVAAVCELLLLYDGDDDKKSNVVKELYEELPVNGDKKMRKKRKTRGGASDRCTCQWRTCGTGRCGCRKRKEGCSTKCGCGGSCMHNIYNKRYDDDEMVGFMRENEADDDDDDDDDAKAEAANDAKAEAAKAKAEVERAAKMRHDLHRKLGNNSATRSSTTRSSTTRSSTTRSTNGGPTTTTTTTTTRGNDKDVEAMMAKTFAHPFFKQ